MFKRVYIKKTKKFFIVEENRKSIEPRKVCLSGYINHWSGIK